MADSYIPSIYSIPSGFSQTTPYYGTDAPNGIFPTGTSPTMGGTFSQYREMINRGYTPEQAAPYMNAQEKQQLASGTPLTVIGQGEGWLTPDQLRAKTNALGTNLDGSYGGTSGSGSGSIGSGSNGTAGLGGSISNGLLSGGTMPQPSGPAGISGFPDFQTGTANNYLPTDQTNGVQSGSVSPLSMSQSTPQNALNQYYNTAGYQLTNGPGAVNQFQTSPGYQFAVNQALQQVQQNAASRGLLDSGAGLRAMTDRAQGMANQEFNNWQQNQQNQYNAYQNRLAGLASGPTGADYAFQTGQGLANNAMQTGSNIGSLLANQGNSLFGGIVGAGGAQAQNVSQAGNMQAQILGGNLATQLAAASLGGYR